MHESTSVTNNVAKCDFPVAEAVSRHWSVNPAVAAGIVAGTCVLGIFMVIALATGIYIGRNTLSASGTPHEGVTTIQRIPGLQKLAEGALEDWWGDWFTIVSGTTTYNDEQVVITWLLKVNGGFNQAFLDIRMYGDGPDITLIDRDDIAIARTGRRHNPGREPILKFSPSEMRAGENVRCTLTMAIPDDVDISRVKNVRIESGPSY